MRQKTTQFLSRWQTTLLLVVLLTGCTSTQWTWQHPDGLDNTSLQLSEQECRQLAEKEIDRFDYYLPYYDNPYYYDRYHHSRSYDPYYPRRTYYDFPRYNRDLQKLFRFCMQARGWQRVEVNKEQP